MTMLDLQERLSPHFTVGEAVASQTARDLGIDNTQVSSLVLANAKNTAQNMETVRKILNNSPINVSSFIRTLPLNRALGSRDTSQHVVGEAVDFTCPKFGTPLDICRALIASDSFSFDQLILEHTWVHISFKNPSSKNRKQVLSLLQNGKYSVGLTDKKGNKL